MAMKRLLPVILIFGIFFVAVGQDFEYDLDQPEGYMEYLNMPSTDIIADNLEYMRAFYPLFYDNEYQIRRDIRFINRNDSEFVALWDSVGNSVLHTIKTLSGIEWVEKNVDLHFVKYLPSAGLYDPLVMPWEGIKTRDYIEAAPTGLYRFLNLIRLLSGRNIKQVFDKGNRYYYLSGHPLLQESAYRFDLMTVSVSLAVAEHFIPPDSIDVITSSGSWRRHNPSWRIYESYIEDFWNISFDSSLTHYLEIEWENSPLVELTQPPRPTGPKTGPDQTAETIRLQAGGGRLGFSVMKTSSGLLEVVDVDSLKIAYSAGLMIGDRIRRVNGENVRNARSLMGKILDKIDTDGVYMEVLRDDQEIGLLLLPEPEV
jgi:hypothetical protein